MTKVYKDNNNSKNKDNYNNNNNKYNGSIIMITKGNNK